jgi:hypothetical protein
MNDWLTKDRSETAYNRMPDRVSQHGVTVSNPALGINIYNNAMSEDLCKDIINTLEDNLNGQGMFKWQGARVTEAEEVLSDARNCVDFKVSSNAFGARSNHNAPLYDMHESAFESIRPCADDYGQYWGVGIGYYEAFNFVKYDGPGTHFKIHADHGPAYVSTISIVAYLNDDYEGGELYFPRFDLTIKPKRGDVMVFPSTYIYEHASQDMINGKKYAIVVMTDYNDRGGLRFVDYRSMDHTKIVY